MKASELVEKLNAHIVIFGDKDIEIYDSDQGSTIPDSVIAWDDVGDFASPDKQAVKFQIV